MDTVLIGAHEIKSVLSMEKAIELSEVVYRDHGNNRAILPPKMNLPMGENGEWPHYYGSSNAMPAYVDSLKAMGIKFASGFKQNYKRGIPFIHALIILTSPDTGEPVAVMDGTYITAIRTGAATAVGVKYMFPTAKTVGIIGAGIQGRMNAVALSKVLDINKCFVFDTNTKNANSLVEELNKSLDAKVISSDIKTICQECEVIVTATTANEALIRREWLREPVLVIPLGSYQEVEDDVILSASKIVVDNVEQVSHRGELYRLFKSGQLDENDIYAELGDIVVEKKEAKITNNKIYCLCQIGIGSLDIGIAKYVFDELYGLRELPMFKFDDIV